MPQTITQPDGTVIHCFASGDEFHNWLHDSAGYTIIQNAKTGYYVYAVQSGEEVAASEYVVGRVNPVVMGLSPEVNISAQAWIAKRDAFFADVPVNMQKAKTRSAGSYTNLVFFIRFAGDTGFIALSPKNLTEMYNDSSSWDANSMYNFYRRSSYGKVYINSYFFPSLDTANNVVFTYQDTFPRSYYRPYDSVSNPNGYTNNRTSRERALLGRVIEYFKDSVPTTINLDNNGNGYIDNVSFFISGRPDGWNSLLWPHRSYYSDATKTINGKKIRDYNLLLEYRSNSGSTRMGSGVISHEMMHSLGAPDLYHYSNQTTTPTPVGIWDLMESTIDARPQGLSAYMKYQYGGWIDSIPEITQSGTYTLYPANGDSPEKTAYKIYSDPSADEYLVLEYRNIASNIFEAGLPGSGILIYRINENIHGNSGYDGITNFDEVYLFRPNGTTTVNGNLSQAHFSADVNRTEFGSHTNPYPFYSNGWEVDNILITNITTAGDSIQFTINMSATTNELSIVPQEMLLGCKLSRDNYFSIKSTTSWTLSNPCSWIKILNNQTSGRGNDEVNFRIAENEETTSRTCTLRVNTFSLTDMLIITQNPCNVSIENINQNTEIKIYPNPTSSQLRIEDYKLRIENIEFFDMYGRKAPLSSPEGVKLPSFGGAGGGVIDISHFPAGIYVLKITTEDKQIYTKKIIVYQE